MQSMKKKTLITSALSIALCLSIASGATFALFSDTEEMNIVFSAANIEMEADVEDFAYRTANITDWTTATNRQTTFDNVGGNASYSDGTLSLNKLVPGDEVKFTVVTENKSDIKVRYRTLVKNVEAADTGLFEALNISINDMAFTESRANTWSLLDIGEDPEEISVVVSFPMTGLDDPSNNLYQGKSCAIQICVEAIQGNIDPEHSREFAPTATISQTSYSLEEGSTYYDTKGRNNFWTFVEDSNGTITIEEFGNKTYDNPLVVETAADKNNRDTVALSEKLPGAASTEIVVETMYTFTAEHLAASEAFHQDAENGTRFAHWGMDFVIYSDTDIEPYTAGVVGELMGMTVGFILPERLPANTPIRVMNIVLQAGASMYGVYSIPYWIIADLQSFTCGPVDVGYINAGKKLTVELRLYELEYDLADLSDESLGSYQYSETGEYFVI